MSGAVDVQGQVLDLTACDREPIERLGLVQPHGLLVGLREPDLVVDVVSEGTERFLGRPVEEVLGRLVDDVLPQPVADLAFDVGDGLGRPGTRSAVIERPGATPLAVEASGHRTDTHVVIEVEHQTATAEDGTVHAAVGRGLAALQAARRPEDLCDALAQCIRTLTGHDRVMVYRFAPDLHGEVVAEDVRDDLEPFLGLHYPASDIPAQARALYLRNRLRLIADVAAEPDPLRHTGPAGAPFDLSGASLRAVSPIHIAYLRNMGVASSMSVSLVVDDALWGLIACHHTRPWPLPLAVRQACELLGQAAGSILGALESSLRATAQQQVATAHGHLVDAAAKGPTVGRALTEGGTTLLDLVPCGGAAVVSDETVHTVGQTPDEADVARIVAALGDLPAGEPAALESVWGRDGAPSDERACGVLALDLDGAGERMLLWFRPEAVREVHWGGDPRKPVGDDDVLTPRSSFTAWRQTVRGRSQPWTPAEVQAVARLWRSLSAIMLRRGEAARQDNLSLRRALAELDSFAAVASHDLKEPLRGIRSDLGRALEGDEPGLGHEGRRRLERAARLTVRLEEHVDALLALARSSQMELEVRTVRMDEVLDTAVALVGDRLREAGVALHRDHLPSVRADADALVEVVVNLLTNAMKHSDRPEPTITVHPGPPDPAQEGMTVLVISDDGPGVPVEERERVFEPFRRLGDGAVRGTGLGLAIVRRVIERLGGAVWLEDAEPRGTAVCIALPEAQR